MTNKIFKKKKVVYFFSFIVAVIYLITSPYQVKSSEVLDADNSRLLNMIESDPKQVLKEVPLSKRVTLTGTLEVVHQDYFNQNKSKNFYFLKDSTGKKISLYFGKGEPSLSKSGSKIKIKQGARIGNKMAVESVNNKYFQVISKPKIAQSGTGTKKIAVILFNFSDNNNQPYTVDYLRKLIFTGKHDESQDSVNEFYQENSFEKTKLEGHSRSDGDFYGWYTISSKSSDGCDNGSWGTELVKKAKEDGYNSGNYYSTVYIFPYTNSCDFGGMATGSESGWESWINSTSIYVIAHEIGHNLGLSHASSYYCTDSLGNLVSISNSCTKLEYGDPYDVMGNSLGQINTAAKGKLKWYSSQNKTEITEDGTYTLYPLENSSSGAQSLRIARKDSSGTTENYYYIEYRQLSKYDYTKGVFVRIGYNYENFDRTYLVDTDVSSDSYSLDTDKIFYDSLFGIEITTTEVSSFLAKVQVKFKKTDECVRASPSITISPESYTGKGEQATYNIKITNNDKNCSATKYSYSIDWPDTSSGWVGTTNGTENSISAQSSKESTVTLSPPSDVKEGKYSFTIKIKNPLDESYSSSVTGYYVVDYFSNSSSVSASSVSSSLSSSSSRSSSSSSSSFRSSSSKSRSSSSSSVSANHVAVTNLATNITHTSATLNGKVNPKGENVYYQFKYRKEAESPELTKKTAYVFAGNSSSNVSVSSVIADLSPGTKYVYRLYAYSYTTNKEVSGSLKSFRTSKHSSSSSRSSKNSSSKSRNSSRSSVADS